MMASMNSSAAAVSRAKYPIKRDMGSPSVDYSVGPGSRGQPGRFACCWTRIPVTATIAFVMKHVIEERLPCSDDALRGAHWRHEAGASACSLVRPSHLGELTFPSASQSAREALNSVQLSSRSSAARRRLASEGRRQESRPGEPDRALAAAQRAGNLPNDMLKSTRSEPALSTSSARCRCAGARDARSP
jgi:hypothetical protein